MRDHVLVMVSELVTNSVLHGGASEQDLIELSLAWRPEVLRVEVMDSGPGFGASLADPDRQGGWGLQLVERMADRWGVIRTDATIVWFEMLLVVVIVVVAGTLFWYLVKAMARIQMPERPGASR